MFNKEKSKILKTKPMNVLKQIELIRRYIKAVGFQFGFYQKTQEMIAV